MKVALSIPDDLFASAETLGKRLGVSRSRLYATALADYVARHQSRKVTARLDAVYATEESRLDRSVRRAQAGSLPHDSW
jgi:metal-responsive CopG/Arc/MetJ family transcriptional regulator